MYPPFEPVLFQVGFVTLHWYGLSMTLAIFLGTWIASRYVTRHGGNGGAIWDMLLWVLVPGIIGARLYYVFIQSSPERRAHYLANPIEILQIWSGGIHIYGALILGAVALYLYLRLNKLPYLLFLDGIGLGLALGQAIGRFGNFINQELYGPPTTLPWGLRIEPEHRIGPYTDLVQYPDATRFHPLFLYEMIWDVIGFVLLLFISRRFGQKLLKGDLFLMYLIWIPFGRFLLEFLRTDSWFFSGTPFNPLHIIIALLVVGALGTLIWRHRGQQASAPAVTHADDTDQNDPDASVNETVEDTSSEDAKLQEAGKNDTVLNEQETPSEQEEEKVGSVSNEQDEHPKDVHPKSTLSSESSS